MLGWDMVSPPLRRMLGVQPWPVRACWCCEYVVAVLSCARYRGVEHGMNNDHLAFGVQTAAIAQQTPLLRWRQLRANPVPSARTPVKSPVCAPTAQPNLNTHTTRLRPRLVTLSATKATCAIRSVYRLYRFVSCLLCASWGRHCLTLPSGTSRSHCRASAIGTSYWLPWSYSWSWPSRR